MSKSATPIAPDPPRTTAAPREARHSEPRDLSLFAAAAVLITVVWLAALALGAIWLLGVIF
jgi:hypothetical protein